MTFYGSSLELSTILSIGKMPIDLIIIFLNGHLLLRALMFQNLIQSTMGFATMGKAANLALATRNPVTDLF